MITITRTRIPLMEGRRNGMAFGFLKKLRGNNYITASAISPCKDYLNDVVYNEITRKPIKVYGATLGLPLGLFKQSHIYLGVSNASSNKNETLPFPSPVTADFINVFDEKMGYELSTIEMDTESDLYIIKADKRWAETTWGISLYTLLWRTSLEYNKDFTFEACMNYLESDPNIQDRYLINTCLPVLGHIFENGFKKQVFTNMTYHNIHDAGICTYKI